LQAKLTIGASDDSLEQEADRIANQVMGMPEVSYSKLMLTSKSAASTKNENGRTPLRTKRAESFGAGGIEAPASVGEVLRSQGHRIDTATRTFFEARFGHDFSNVRVHADSGAAQSARDINALAYTFRNHIVFGSNSYRPQLSEGRQLIAHELTHVLQQSGSNDGFNSIHRTVASTSRCAANANQAPPDPLAELNAVDTLAQNMALGASNVLSLESLTFNDPALGGRSYVFDAYRDWFGTPQQTSSGAWRSRFRTATFATEDEAVANEMQVLSNRFESIHNWLGSNIHYRCLGTGGSFTIPGCEAGRCTAQAAFTCPGGSHIVAVCPGFWVEPTPRDRAQAAVLIHEAIHPLFHFSAHSTATVAGRGRNPGCYQGFAHSIFNTNLLPGDCTMIGTP
jgi:hypothetical protein